MTTQFLIEAPIALAPVLAFLGVLLYFDSYRLINLIELVQAIVAGIALAVAAYYINGTVLQALALDYTAYSRFAGPAVEETLKAAALVFLFARNRIGFMIDATILGFAVGTGFALFENVFFLQALQDADFGTWIIRGFGTAIMHGGATAMFAALSESLIERRGGPRPVYFFLALVAAIVVHVAYNLLTGMPLLSTVAVLLGLPVIFLLIFTKSEHAVHQWLVDDYKSHRQLLDEIDSGQFAHSEAGRFVVGLAKKFDQAVIDDIFEYLKLHTQVVLRAESMSLARENNQKPEPRTSIRDDLKRLDVLEKKIGRVAMMALWPHLHFSRRELWELHELQG
ncbi:MAG TPA: PrsW family glutamic-type intramembrane protease [Rhizomicrobium sp.]|jgi:RsiW-degrading membrane proteinase PrsW (M82 family)|nr:PrsW family glutamic-type intramembrane protease [Rhizomicrobium sp.]